MQGSGLHFKVERPAPSSLSKVAVTLDTLNSARAPIPRSIPETCTRFTKSRQLDAANSVFGVTRNETPIAGEAHHTPEVSRGSKNLAAASGRRAQCVADETVHCVLDGNVMVTAFLFQKTFLDERIDVRFV